MYLRHTAETSAAEYRQSLHMPMSNDKNLVIMTAGLTRSEKNSLEILLPRRLQYDISIVERAGSDPDIILYCLDQADAQYNLQHIKDAHFRTPIICLSHNDTPHEGTAFVKRPIKVDQLVKAIDKALEDNPTIGKAPVIQPSAHKEIDAPHFHMGEKLIGKLLEARKISTSSNQNVLVEGIGFFLFRKDGNVYTNNKKNTIRSMCVPTLYSGSITTMVISENQVNKLLKKQNKPIYGYSTEALLWDVAGWCSRGALPKGLQTSKPLTITMWPNCTELANSLGAVAMSSIFAQGAISIADAAEAYDVPVSTLSVYITSCHATGILSTNHKGASSSKKKGGQRKGKTGILGKLARRLANRVFGK